MKRDIVGKIISEKYDRILSICYTQFRYYRAPLMILFSKGLAEDYRQEMRLAAYSCIDMSPDIDYKKIRNTACRALYHFLRKNGLSRQKDRKTKKMKANYETIVKMKPSEYMDLFEKNFNEEEIWKDGAELVEKNLIQ